jgi:hypothetical protein
MANIPAQLYRGDSDYLGTISNVDGQILFDTDKKEIFMDDGTTRESYGGGAGDKKYDTLAQAQADIANISDTDTVFVKEGTSASLTQRVDDLETEVTEISSDLSELVIPFVNTASTPLYSFTDGANTYTATENCVLIGNHLWPSSDGNSLIMLDGVTVSVAKRTANTNIYTNPFIYIPIKAGQVITTSSNFRYDGGGSPLYVRKILS